MPNADRHSVESWAAAGLLRAIDNYDPLPRGEHTKPVSFAMYATRSMSSVTLDGLRKEDFAPRSLRRRQRAIEEARTSLTHQLGRPPQQRELAQQLGLTDHQLSTTMAEIKNSWIDSTDVADVENDRPHQPNNAMAETLRDALVSEANRLPPLSMTLIALCHFEEMSVADAARAIGIPASYARTNYQRAVLQLNEAMLRAAYGERTA
jgi:RNA polymerase sigma factor for flagellar operon FliA